MKASAGLLYEAESTYQYVQVLERADGSRALKLNEGVAVHSLWEPDSVLTGGEWDMFLLVPPLLDGPVEDMAVIGNAGGTIARAFGTFYPDVRIDGVEIDPDVTEAGRRYLGLDDNPNLERRSRRTDGPSSRGPTAATTSSSSTRTASPTSPSTSRRRSSSGWPRARLKPGGVLALNVARVPGDERLSRAIGSTIRAAFPQAWVWKPLRFNELMLGFDRPTTAAELGERVGSWIERGSRLSSRSSGTASAQVEPIEEPLTDDRAPVEWLTDR